MAEREPEPSEEVEASIETSAAAVAAALDQARADPALRAEIPAFFAAQRRLAEAQLHHMKVQLRHLGLKVLGERLRLFLQILTVAGALLVLGVVCYVVYDAMDDHGLVVESFSSSPPLVARGLNGEALADQLLGRIGAIRRTANANSITVSDDVRAGRSETLKVEIPETGLSLDQVQRFLHQALGHTRRLSGSVSDDGRGHVVIDVQLAGADPIVVEGASSDLDQLMQQAAERAFAAFDPVNYVLYLFSVGRPDDALAAAEHNYRISDGPLDVSNALSLWGNSDGDRRRALAHAALSTEVYPKGWSGWFERANASRDLGHDEDVLVFDRRGLATHAGDQWRNHRPWLPFLMQVMRAAIDRVSGDYASLEVDVRPFPAHDFRSGSERRLERIDVWLGRHDCAAAADDLAAARLLAPLSPRVDAGATAQLAACRGDASAALAAAQAVVAADQANLTDPQTNVVDQAKGRLSVVDRPALAEALVAAGQADAAQGAISDTPLDCYLCLRVRGRIAAAKGDKIGADHWFGEAVRQAPSVPFAYVEWARARLDRGDVTGAIAELEIASQKSPAFPDTPEVWGEALMRGGDPTGALSRFAAAERLAPHWTRLHLMQAKAREALRRGGAS